MIKNRLYWQFKEAFKQFLNLNELVGIIVDGRITINYDLFFGEVKKRFVDERSCK